MQGVAYRSKLFDRNYLNLCTLERDFIATNASCNQYKTSLDGKLHRYEFIEILVRLAQTKYRDSKICLTLHEGLGK